MSDYINIRQFQKVPATIGMVPSEMLVYKDNTYYSRNSKNPMLKGFYGGPYTKKTNSEIQGSLYVGIQNEIKQAEYVLSVTDRISKYIKQKRDSADYFNSLSHLIKDAPIFTSCTADIVFNPITLPELEELGVAIPRPYDNDESIICRYFRESVDFHYDDYLKLYQTYVNLLSEHTWQLGAQIELEPESEPYPIPDSVREVYERVIMYLHNWISNATTAARRSITSLLSTLHRQYRKLIVDIRNKIRTIVRTLRIATFDGKDDDSGNSAFTQIVKITIEFIKSFKSCLVLRKQRNNYRWSMPQSII